MAKIRTSRYKGRAKLLTSRRCKECGRSARYSGLCARCYKLRKRGRAAVVGPMKPVISSVKHQSIDDDSIVVQLRPYTSNATRTGFATVKVQDHQLIDLDNSGKLFSLRNPLSSEEHAGRYNQWIEAKLSEM